MEPMPYKFANTVRCNSVYNSHSINHDLLTFHHVQTEYKEFGALFHTSEIYIHARLLLLSFLFNFWEEVLTQLQHLLEVTSTFCVVAIFVIVDLSSEFCIRCVRMFVIYHI
jgi:hypothetical protein